MRLIVSNCRRYYDSDFPITENARWLEKLEIKKAKKLTAKRSSRKIDCPVNVHKKLKLVQIGMEKLTKKMNNLLKQIGPKKSNATSSSLTRTRPTKARDSFKMQSDANEESGKKSRDNSGIKEDETNPDNINNEKVQKILNEPFDLNNKDHLEKLSNDLLGLEDIEFFLGGKMEKI
ncbi:hypothetical protein QR98_0094610 [Sarcoptes scabiei]|uniref:Uncharacterized protein n=1 Tax=Sarcoptes scabiei TaxID=52283 RepID=A0A132AIT2_SARSC|nr:hypothetical protein QR98_0094610 [Sarcoptes scabiei]